MSDIHLPSDHCRKGLAKRRETAVIAALNVGFTREEIVAAIMQTQAEGVPA
ncbi:hypothetical protein NWF24_24340 [Variovorax paradoxus]|uniref:hypothetical protein n=1 Tax=Variovorax paradoxus TaxID=34073 RepID=UPI0021ACB730|nr:hypothetical protein [Variovorax paradoxus]UVH55951.1 hypothetical protein NWF24_24340 [Variovorax paradoxus]